MTESQNPAPPSNAIPAPPTAGAGTPPAPPSRRNLLVLALGLLFAGFVIALIAVLHRPGYVVLAPLHDGEELWFRERLDRFAASHHVRLTLATYRGAADLERQLALDTHASHPRVLAVLVLQASLVPLVDAKLVRPLGELVGGPRVDRLLAGFLPEALAPARVNGVPCYVPRNLSATCLYYSKSHLADAVAHWSEVRATVEAWFEEANGSGLPRGYALEADPREWDTYDLAVVAAYWASRPFDGLKTARVAHRARRDGGAAVDLASAIYVQGGSSEDLLALDGLAVWDALAWESFFLAHGLYHPAMVREGWDEPDLLTAIAQGQIYLCFLDPTDLFAVHGTTEPAAPAFLRNPADLGVARLPRGASLDLVHGSAARIADPFAARTGTWWGVPRTAPDPPLALTLLEHVSSPEFMTEASRAFGLYPTLRDLDGGLDGLYRENWAYAIARVARKQILDFGRPLPGTRRWTRAREVLVAAWSDVCVNRKLTKTKDIAGALGAYTGALAMPPGAPVPTPSSGRVAVRAPSPDTSAQR